MENLTPVKIYKMIVMVVFQHTMMKHMYPESDMTVDKANRLANLEAVKTTWYWFNHQKEFLKLPSINFYCWKEL